MDPLPCCKDVDETRMPEVPSHWIMHVSPCCRECTRHLQPDHSSSSHSLQLGLWVHPATLWPWKKQEPELHRVHPVPAGTQPDLNHDNLFRSGPRTDLTPKPDTPLWFEMVLPGTSFQSSPIISHCCFSFISCCMEAAELVLLRAGGTCFGPEGCGLRMEPGGPSVRQPVWDPFVVRSTNTSCHCSRDAGVFTSSCVYRSCYCPLIHTWFSAVVEKAQQVRTRSFTKGNHCNGCSQKPSVKTKLQLSAVVSLLCDLPVWFDELWQQTLTWGQPSPAPPSDCRVVISNHLPVDTPAGLSCWPLSSSEGSNCSGRGFH